MTVAIDRMKAMVITGSRSCFTVLVSVVASADGETPKSSIGTKARSAATKTSVPAAARKSSRYVSGYALETATTGDSRCTSGDTLPARIAYAPGQLNSHTGNRNP